MNNKKKVEKCTKLPGGMPLCQEPTFLILYPTLMKDQLEEWRASSDLVVYIVVMFYTFQVILGKEADITTYKVQLSFLVDCSISKHSQIRENVGLRSRCIDYILYCSDCVTPVSVLNIPSRQCIGERGLPNLTFPSDHLPLLVNFKLAQ